VANSFVLSHSEVSRLLASVHLPTFLKELVEEIERAYGDPTLESIERTGWIRTPDTLEIMGCQAQDFTCIKVISSNPSLADTLIPTVTGTLVCTDVTTDEARLICDAAILTSLRTAASTAVVLRRATPHAATLGVIGAGLEGACHALVLAILLPSIQRICFTDVEPAKAADAVAQVTTLLSRETEIKDRGIEVKSIDAANGKSVFESDAIVTATYGTTEVVRSTESLRAGTTIAAVGADLQGKRELGYRIYDKARFVADDLSQCLHEGELEVAKRRLRVDMDEKSHRGVLQGGRIMGVADLLENETSFFARKEPLIVYDSTGFSGQDLAIARVVLRHLEAQDWQPSVWNPSNAVPLPRLLGRDEYSS